MLYIAALFAAIIVAGCCLAWLHDALDRWCRARPVPAWLERALDRWLA